MAQSNIGIRFNVDTSQAKTQVDDLAKTVSSLHQEIVKATQAGDWRQVAQLTQAIDSATSAKGQIMRQATQSQSQQAAANMRIVQEMQSGGFMQGATWIMFQQALNQITQGIIKSMDSALTAAKQRASGDYTGATVSQIRANGEIAGQGIGTAIGALGFLGGPLLGALTMGIGSQIGQFIGGIGAKKLEADLAFSSQYKNALPLIDSLNQLYGGAINQKSFAENNRHGLQMYDRAAAATAGTGLSTQDFISALKESGAYGNMSETKAMNMLQTQALWARFSGADLSALQKQAGIAYRYAGETNANATAYGGLMASNMGKGQFSEFLNSMQRIMEEGIAKGFVKSSEQIAGNMAMLYKLSGGSALWQGQQGANRLSQMNNALSNATRLETVEDVISFGVVKDILGNDESTRRSAFNRLAGGGGVGVTGNANFRSSAAMGDNVMGTITAGSNVDILGIEGEFARISHNGRDGYIHKSLLNMRDYNAIGGGVYTGTYADIMQILERGISGDILGGQFNAVKQLEGGNVAGSIERFRNMYGLNYTGAAQVYGMMERGWNSETRSWNAGYDPEDMASQIKAMQENPRYQSDSSMLQTELNKMNANLVNIGKVKFDDTEIGMLRAQADDVELIRMKLCGDPGVRPEANTTSSITTPSMAATIPTSMGGGPRGALQLFQGGENYAGYMMSGMTGLDRQWDRILRYYDSKPDDDLGKIMIGQVGTALERVDLNAASAERLERPLGIAFENFTVQMHDAIGILNDVSRNEASSLQEPLRNLINVLENLARIQERDHDIQIRLIDER